MTRTHHESDFQTAFNVWCRYNVNHSLYLYPTCGEIGKAVIENVRMKKDYQP